ncbi:MAG TPA: hypothetical protein QF540_03565 [Gammaproteobacteria bacterium]|nr:hypothetical protein [Gammaproteobacteria bacterium]MBQ09869.1 hypothetical protein [Gammaproteobacteria bacterium]HJM08873.1 hypothetical protein [Gammaproteobacteria bacterium]HJN00614.1 hypothetical protein [Gammaproteobacteria bacterium]
MTVIILLVIIVLLATISGWNYYQTNQKISSLLTENSTLQINYQLEISTLEDITDQTRAELLEQRALINEIQSKVGSIEDIERQDRDYWLTLQIEYFLNLADSELFLGRNNERANDLIKQAKISALGLSQQNQDLLIQMDSLIESIDLFIDQNKTDDIRAIIDQIGASVIEPQETSVSTRPQVKPSFSIDWLRQWIGNTLENFENNWSNIILVKSKSTLDITKLSNEEQRVIESLIVLNIDLIRLALQSGNEPRYLAAVIALEEKLNRYYQTNLNESLLLSENISALKKHRMHPAGNGIKIVLEIVEEMKKQ